MLAMWLCLPLPVSAETEVLTPTQPIEPAGRIDQNEQNKRLYIIVGVTVFGVTGMWMSFYRRGK